MDDDIINQAEKFIANDISDIIDSWQSKSANLNIDKTAFFGVMHEENSRFQLAIGYKYVHWLLMFKILSVKIMREFHISLQLTELSEVLTKLSVILDSFAIAKTFYSLILIRFQMMNSNRCQLTSPNNILKICSLHW